MSSRAAYVPHSNIALFLDVDGTLLEIAPTPDTVRVPAALRNTLHLAMEREEGALALISGRTIAELDRLFAPHEFPAAGQHGFEMRTARGTILRPEVDPHALDRARRTLTELLARDRGLLLEDKGSALAMHYRLAPRCESLVAEVMTGLAADLAEHLTLRPGKCVLELAPRGYSKRYAIDAFMRERPFAGRVPVFVGDDPTDEDGFDAVNAMGGYSIRVGNLEPTHAEHRFSSVSTVVAWLRDRNLSRRTARA